MNSNARNILIVAAVALLLLIVVPLLVGGLSGWQGGGWGMMGPGMMGGGGWMWFMPFTGILFLVLIVWGVGALTQGPSMSGGDGHSSGHTDSALDILKRRYARGEIDKAEYEAKRRDLE